MPSFRKLTALIALVAMCAGQAAAGGVNIAPTRAVLAERQQAAAFTIYNDDPMQTVTYRVALSDRVMAPDGSVRPLAEGETPPPGWRSARPYLRFSPAQVALAPGASQTIRVAWRPPADISPGEYRTHLTVSALPPPSPAADDGAGRGVTVRLNAVQAVAVPVIVRVGAVAATATLDHARFTPASAGRAPSLTLELTRHGDASVSGDIAVVYTPPGGGRPEMVGQIRKVATYTELSARPVTIAVEPPREGFAPGGRLVARLYADIDQRGAPLAEAETPTP